MFSSRQTSLDRKNNEIKSACKKNNRLNNKKVSMRNIFKQKTVISSRKNDQMSDRSIRTPKPQFYNSIDINNYNLCDVNKNNL